MPLRFYDVAQTEASRDDQGSDKRQPERDFVADHLRAGTQATEQRVLIIGGPAGERDSVNAHRSNAEYNQQADVEVGDLQERAPRSDVNPVSKRDHGDGWDRKNHRDHGRSDVKRLVNMRL